MAATTVKRLKDLEALWRKLPVSLPQPATIEGPVDASMWFYKTDNLEALWHKDNLPSRLSRCFLSGSK